MSADRYMLARLAVAGNSTKISPFATIQDALLAWRDGGTIERILDGLCGHDHRPSGRADRRHRRRSGNEACQEPEKRGKMAEQTAEIANGQQGPS